MTTLRRRDPARRMARFYLLGTQFALPFAPEQLVDLVREWGRIGSSGTVRVDQHADPETAAKAAAMLEAAKRRRGYR
jgi:predicted DNA-binding WGR domain protein